jgi:hypothetical protein
MTFQIRHLSPANYPSVISVTDRWWGGRPLAGKLPRPRSGFSRFSPSSDSPVP